MMKELPPMLDDVELRALCAQAWRRQIVADERLARKLAASPRPAPVVIVKPKVSSPSPVQLTFADLFHAKPDK